MSTNRFFGEDIKTTTLNAAIRSRKAAIDDFGLEPKCFEDLSAFVTCQGTDSHLGHYFQHAFGNSLSIGSYDFFVIYIGQQAVAAGLP